MEILSWLSLFVLVALVGYWLTSIRVLEIARNAGRQACNDAQLQFLDDTVASIAIGIARDESGRRVLRRIYRFEFSESGNTRIEGQVIMLGNKVESVTMDPYQILE